jgi:acyl carrier protein
MSATLERQNSNRSSSHAEKIQPGEGMQILERLVREQPVQAVILPVNLNKLSQGDRLVQPLLRTVVKARVQDPSKSPGLILESIKGLPLERQKAALQEYVQGQVVKTLGLDPSQPFNALRPLTDLGMDSLMAVELKNKIEGDTGVNIPVPYFLESATVAALAGKIMEQMGHGTSPVDMDNPDQTIDADQAKQLLENLDGLSEDEVDSLLDHLLPKTEEL